MPRKRHRRARNVTPANVARNRLGFTKRQRELLGLTGTWHRVGDLCLQQDTVGRTDRMQVVVQYLKKTRIIRLAHLRSYIPVAWNDDHPEKLTATLAMCGTHKVHQ